jgi:hypothetical protein
METKTAFTAYNQEIDFEPKNYMGTLDWFNIAQCARKRMSETSPYLHTWRGNRRSFYTALQMMDVHNVYYMD